MPVTNAQDMAKAGSLINSDGTTVSVAADLLIADKLVHTGDTNTAIRFPAADTVTVETSGTERVRVDSSGNVGIGTASPSIDWSGDARALRINGSGTQACGVRASNANGSAELVISGTTSLWGLYSPSNLPFALYTAGTERLRIDSSGNVGIGTTSPSGRLSVSSGSAAQYASFNSNAANGGYLTIESSGTVHGDIGTAAQLVSGGSASDFGINARGLRNLVLGTNNAERLRIDSSGNVGIGTTSPAARLHILGAGATSYDYVDGHTVGQALYLQSTGGASGDGGQILFGATQGVFAGIKGFISNGSGPAGSLVFQTRFTSGNVLGRLIILDNGNVGIGTMFPSAQLELSTDSAKKPSTNTWTIASDSRLKTNITEADKDRCLEIVRQIPLKRYTWKNEVYSQEAVKDRSKLGWIAQDVESIFPKAVGTNRFAYNQVFEDVVTPELDADGNPVLDEDGNAKTKTEKRLVSEDVIEDCKDLNSDQIYAVMYGAIQKLAEENDSLKARIAALEAA